VGDDPAGERQRGALADAGVDTALVSAILAMANALGLSVIAEGVETAEQQTALLALGCRSGQGYRYGKPGAFTPERWLAQASERSAT